MIQIEPSPNCMLLTILLLPIMKLRLVIDNGLPLNTDMVLDKFSLKD